MMFLLATIDNPSAVEIGAFLVLLTTVIGIFAKLNGAKKEFVKEVLLQLRAEQQQTREGAPPQPFEVVGKVEFTSRQSFEKHAELNRVAHDKIEKEMRDSIRRIEDSIVKQGEAIVRQSALRESNGEQLHVITSQLAEMQKDVSELGGVIHEMHRKGKV